MKKEIQLRFLAAYCSYATSDYSTNFTSKLESQPDFFDVARHGAEYYLKHCFEHGKSFGWTNDQIISAIVRGLVIPNTEEMIAHINEVASYKTKPIQPVEDDINQG